MSTLACCADLAGRVRSRVRQGLANPRLPRHSKTILHRVHKKLQPIEAQIQDAMESPGEMGFLFLLIPSLKALLIMAALALTGVGVYEVTKTAETVRVEGQSAISAAGKAIKQLAEEAAESGRILFYGGASVAVLALAVWAAGKHPSKRAS